MNTQDRVATFRDFFKVFSILAGCLIFNHTSSSLLLKLLGFSSLSIVIVYTLCFSTLLLLWYRLERSFKARQTYEKQNLLRELRSLDAEKIPFIIDRFLTLDRIRSREMGAVYPLEKQCVVCLDAEARIQTFPCKHVVVCGWCAWQSSEVLLLTAIKPSLCHMQVWNRRLQWMFDERLDSHQLEGCKKDCGGRKIKLLVLSLRSRHQVNGKERLKM